MGKLAKKRTELRETVNGENSDLDEGLRSFIGINITKVNANTLKQLNEALTGGVQYIQVPISGQVSATVLAVISQFYKTHNIPRRVTVATSMPVPKNLTDAVNLLKTFKRNFDGDKVDLFVLENPVGCKDCSFRSIYDSGTSPSVDSLFKRNADGTLLVTPKIIQNLATLWVFLEHEVVDKGLAEGLGLCNFSWSQIREILSVSQKGGIVVQAEINAYCLQKQLIRCCQASSKVKDIFSLHPFGNPNHRVRKGMQVLKKHRTVMKISRALCCDAKVVLLLHLCHQNISPLIDHSMLATPAGALQAMRILEMSKEYQDALSSMPQYDEFGVLSEFQLWKERYPLWPYHFGKTQMVDGEVGDASGGAGATQRTGYEITKLKWPDVLGVERELRRQNRKKKQEAKTNGEENEDTKLDTGSKEKQREEKGQTGNNIRQGKENRRNPRDIMGNSGALVREKEDNKGYKSIEEVGKKLCNQRGTTANFLREERRRKMWKTKEQRVKKKSRDENQGNKQENKSIEEERKKYGSQKGTITDIGREERRKKRRQEMKEQWLRKKLHEEKVERRKHTIRKERRKRKLLEKKKHQFKKEDQVDKMYVEQVDRKKHGVRNRVGKKITLNKVKIKIRHHHHHHYHHHQQQHSDIFSYHAGNREGEAKKKREVIKKQELIKLHRELQRRRLGENMHISRKDRSLELLIMKYKNKHRKMIDIFDREGKQNSSSREVAHGNPGAFEVNDRRVIEKRGFPKLQKVMKKMQIPKPSKKLAEEDKWKITEVPEGKLRTVGLGDKKNIRKQERRRTPNPQEKIRQIHECRLEYELGKDKIWHVTELKEERLGTFEMNNKKKIENQERQRKPKSQERIKKENSWTVTELNDKRSIEKQERQGKPQLREKINKSRKPNSNPRLGKERNSWNITELKADNSETSELNEEEKIKEGGQTQLKPQTVMMKTQISRPKKKPGKERRSWKVTELPKEKMIDKDRHEKKKMSKTEQNKGIKTREFKNRYGKLEEKNVGTKMMCEERRIREAKNRHDEMKRQKDLNMKIIFEDKRKRGAKNVLDKLKNDPDAKSQTRKVDRCGITNKRGRVTLKAKRRAAEKKRMLNYDAYKRNEPALLRSYWQNDQLKMPGNTDHAYRYPRLPGVDERRKGHAKFTEHHYKACLELLAQGKHKKRSAKTRAPVSEAHTGDKTDKYLRLDEKMKELSKSNEGNYKAYLDLLLHEQHKKKPVNCKEKAVNCKEKPVNQKESTNIKEKHVNSKEELVNSGREKHVNRKETAVNHKEESVNSKEKTVNHKEEAVTIKEKHVTIKEKPVNSKEKPLNRKEEPVNRKEKLVNLKEESVNCKEKLVNHKEEFVNHKKKLVKHEEESVNHKEKLVKHKEESVNCKEKPVNSKKDFVTSKEKSVNHKEKHVNRKEKSVSTEVTDLEGSSEARIQAFLNDASALGQYEIPSSVSEESDASSWEEGWRQEIKQVTEAASHNRQSKATHVNPQSSTKMRCLEEDKTQEMKGVAEISWLKYLSSTELHCSEEDDSQESKGVMEASSLKEQTNNNVHCLEKGCSEENQGVTGAPSLNRQSSTKIHCLEKGDSPGSKRVTQASGGSQQSEVSSHKPESSTKMYCSPGEVGMALPLSQCLVRYMRDAYSPQINRLFNTLSNTYNLYQYWAMLLPGEQELMHKIVVPAFQTFCHNFKINYYGRMKMREAMKEDMIALLQGTTCFRDPTCVKKWKRLVEVIKGHVDAVLVRASMQARADAVCRELLKQ